MNKVIIFITTTTIKKQTPKITCIEKLLCARHCSKDSQAFIHSPTTALCGRNCYCALTG